MSDTVYSVINLNNVSPNDRVKPREDVIYSEVKISDCSHGQKVSSDNLKTETTGSSPPSRRWSTICLGLLCLLLVISIIILVVYLMGVKPKELNKDYSILVDKWNQLTQNYSVLVKEKEQLLLERNTTIRLQEQNEQLQKDFNITVKNMTHLQEGNKQLQKDYVTLQDMKNKLVKEKNNYQQQCSSLQKDKDEIQKNYDALLSKLPLVQKYCHPTENGRVCDPCPQGWEEHKAKCYYFSTSQTTWNESQNNCRKEAAHLVIVNSEEEQNFITKGGNSSHWIGLTGSAEKKVWRWVDDTDLKQGFWLYWEPNNKDQQLAGKTANCVINSKGWMDEPCDDQYQWICETQTLLPKPLHI
ncbi:C-type lectin domain family 10 member A-like [Brienomyrus brachyistius]|uniref:C-type lectin domain family 10 member A-like n=1 Tax=Brienomyrus brachyistius TaxID=42636 RepID=UPI0020B2C727|nr:C-type lectin domain family 10 member A-like [Brienomyrus brachyistius]XP_048837197.1 C-type lectin domain family 10 member A-like [Brienomyrus brachyistius]